MTSSERADALERRLGFLSDARRLDQIRSSVRAAVAAEDDRSRRYWLDYYENGGRDIALFREDDGTYREVE